jgi:3-phosphoshikimate 1-carboxyvinyltransferase
MQFLDLAPVRTASGAIALPGSKSISNRTLLLAALSTGTTEISGLLDSDDTQVMLAALKALGVQWRRHGMSTSYAVDGAGGRFSVRAADLFMGNAGTAIRPLAAALALQGGTYKLSGVPRMHERPIGDLVDGLRQLGADIRYLAADGYPPLQINPADIRVDRPVSLRGDTSSQYLTALLMALPLTGRAAPVVIIGELISKPYVELTLNLLARFGIKVERTDWSRFFIPGDQVYKSPGTIQIEGDASSASYFLAAGVIGGGPVRVLGVGRDSIQGDVRFAATLEQMGGRITYGDNWIEASGPAGGTKLKAIDADLNHIPDAAMTVAMAALFADGTTTIRNIASWRVKETDRIHAMATELRKLGATVEAGTDYIQVTPPATLRWSSIDTYDDHRMAMCFSLAAFGGSSVRINDPACVNKTFPSYFEEFAKLCRET